MNGFLIKLGIIAIVIVVIFIIKTLYDYLYYRELEYMGEDTTNIDEIIKKAATLLTEGSSSDVIKETLLKSIDFEEEDVEEILLQASTHTKDEDKGRDAFIKAAYQVLNRGGLS